MDADTLSSLVEAALGTRGPKEPTKAVAHWAPTDSYWATKQGGYLTDDEMAALKKTLGTQQVFQAWPNMCRTARMTKTGFHAEMIIVSAHIAWKVGDNADARKTAPETIEWDKLTVAANCGCCMHCQLALESLGVNYPGSDYGESNTGWWSPITDIQIAKDDPQFRSGDNLLYVKSTMSTY